jgi:uncharacterized membrane protein YbaN (DUF454 family)
MNKVLEQSAIFPFQWFLDHRAYSHLAELFYSLSAQPQEAKNLAIPRWVVMCETFFLRCVVSM